MAIMREFKTTEKRENVVTFRLIERKSNLYLVVVDEYGGETLNHIVATISESGILIHCDLNPTLGLNIAEIGGIAVAYKGCKAV